MFKPYVLPEGFQFPAEEKVKRTLVLGKIDYNRCGRRTHTLALRLEVRRNRRSSAPYLDWDFNPAPVYTEVSICGDIYHQSPHRCRCGGQISDEVQRYFGERPSVERILELWERWHCNGLRTGSVRQELFLQGYRRALPVERFNSHNYDTSCRILGEAGLIVDRGYRYGSAWLHEPLPVEVEQELLGLFEQRKEEAA